MNRIDGEISNDYLDELRAIRNSPQDAQTRLDRLIKLMIKKEAMRLAAVMR